MNDYKKILEGVVNIINTTEKSDIGFANICTYIGENCPELKESEDEKIRKALLEMVHDTTGDELWVDYNVHKEEALAWLEKQGESYTKKDIDDAYLKGISDAKDELEKQGISAKLSEEEQNSFSKGVLSNCALSFINYLDAHSYEGKMCVSNGECEDIDYAFHNAMWDRLHRYYCKYIEKQGEQKPAVTDFNAKDWYVSKVDGKIHDMTYNPTDKVEPKFHEGEWIVWKNKCYKVNYNGCGYELIDQNGLSTWLEYGTVDTSARLYDVAKDAKDGDVLISQYGNPFIYNGNYNSFNIGAYCGITCDDNKFKVAEEKCHWTENVDIEPSTKEERDLLFAKMKEAGYEWSDKDRKLIKIVNHHKLQATEQQQEHMSFMLGDDSDLLCTYNDGIKIDGYITYDDMAKIVDYLRKEEKI